MINALIVGDEPHARDKLEEKILADIELNIVGKYANVFEAIKKEINNKHLDVVFLNINMPTGTEMLRMLDKKDCQPQPNIVKTLSTNMQFVPCYKGTRDFLINIKGISRAFSNPTTGTHIVTSENCQEFHTGLSLKVLEESTSLVRCHRQHLIDPDCIKMIEKQGNGLGNIHTVSDTIIPVSRRYMKEFCTVL